MLTYDPQGQGQSRHAAARRPTQNEGVPAQSDGRPFFDGTEDALDFFFSTPEAPVRAAPELRDAARATRPSRTAASKAGLDAAYNPFWSCSTRAASASPGTRSAPRGVSYIGQSTRA